MMQQQQSTVVTSVNVQGPPVEANPPTIQRVVAPSQPPTQLISSYPARKSVRLGIVVIIAGVLSVSCNIVDLVISSLIYDGYYSVGYVGHGIWSGVTCVVAGSFAIVAGRRPTTCMIRASMVLCIVASCPCLGQLIASVIGTIRLGIHNVVNRDSGMCCSDSCAYYHYDYHGYYHYDDYDDDVVQCRKVITLIVMESLLAVLSVVGGVSAIVLSVMACKAACYFRQSTYNPYPAQPMTMAQNGTPMTIISQQQGAQMAGYPFQYPAAAAGGAYGPPSYQFAGPPPSYPPPSFHIEQSDKQQLLDD
jgi:hypothetical protein